VGESLKALTRLDPYLCVPAFRQVSLFCALCFLDDQHLLKKKGKVGPYLRYRQIKNQSLPHWQRNNAIHIERLFTSAISKLALNGYWVLLIVVGQEKARSKYQ
jgi:hypothetical protein